MKMKHGNPISNFKATISAKTFLNAGTVSMFLKVPDVSFAPGQFIMLEAPGHTLKRPFVICSVKEGRLRIVFSIRGKGTKTLSELDTGTELDAIAPLGNSFPMPAKDKTVFLIGGGLGTVTMLPLAGQIKAAGIITIIGAKNGDELILADEFKKYGEVLISTDDGSCGKKGSSIDVFNEAVKKFKKNECVVYACGPNPMLRCLAGTIKKTGMECHVSMEERMACGVGACVCCVVKTEKGLKRSCKDGPVFNIGEIIW
ncbi:MAG: dihydroorotate dehydrogenase electron transfer subunit [Oligoflexia bacterium]|nr:dihydroorotate dehydrogenase electron transfer subunit [Oligoflexia bacterium]